MQYSKFRSNWKIFLYIIRNEKKFYEEKKIRKGKIEFKKFRSFLRSKIMQYPKVRVEYIFIYNSKRKEILWRKKKFAKERFFNLKDSEFFFIRKLCKIQNFVQKFAWNIFLCKFETKRNFIKKKNFAKERFWSFLRSKIMQYPKFRSKVRVKYIFM